MSLIYTVETLRQISRKMEKCFTVDKSVLVTTLAAQHSAEQKKQIASQR